MKDYRLEKICQIVHSLQESPTMAVGAGGYSGGANASGPVAGYDPVIGRIDRRTKKQKNYPKLYVQMYQDIMKGKRLKGVMT